MEYVTRFCIMGDPYTKILLLGQFLFNYQEARKNIENLGNNWRIWLTIQPLQPFSLLVMGDC